MRDDLKASTPLKRRKIKIRLADPNVPDSYVCEIYDSSLESEEGFAFNDCLQSKQNQKNGKEEPEEDRKPKNYFELMMSKDGRKSCNNSLVQGNEDSMLSPVHNIKGRPKRKKLTKKKVPQLEKNSSNSSSDDESLFHLSKLLSGSLKPRTEDNVDVQIVKPSNALEESADQGCKLVSSNRVEISSKKKNVFVKNNVSLLSYFSKVETNTESKSSQSSQSTEPDEICITNESLKPCNEVQIVKTVSSESSKNLLGQERKGKSFSPSINNGSFKLAPVFQKKEKNFLSVAAKKERFEFLHSGKPTLSKKLESNKTECSCVCIFPTVSHVQQRDDSSYWHKRKVVLPFLELSYSDDDKVFASDKKFNLSIIKIDTVNNVLSERIEISKEFLNNLKCKYVSLNFDLIFDGLKKKRDSFISLTKELERSRASRTKSRLLNDDQGFEVFNTLWIEKYKPSSSEILGNKSVVQKLRKWLESWKAFDEQLKSLMKSGGKLQNKEGLEDSDDDFLESDEEKYGLESPGNVCLLSGPNGCGKTTLISALANELEFNVLEVNASSKRTGKKVLSDLQEATQSHKVHHSNPFQPGVSTKKGLKKRGQKPRKRKDVSGRKRAQDQTNDCKISLILIEDADIVFEEHDEGFIPAIASLVQTSKRPIIFLTNESQCPYLDNLKTNRCLVLEMERPCFYSSCALLDIVSSLEGVPLKREILEFLIRSNGFDLRKSLLELQFWVESGDNTVNIFQNYDLGRLWWGLSKFLYSQEITHIIRPKSFKRKRSEDLFDSSDEEEIATKKLKLNSDKLINSTNHKPISEKRDPIIHSYYNILDITSTLDRLKLSSNGEPTPGIDYNPKDSLSLEENMEGEYWWERNLTEELFGELIFLSSRIFAYKCKRKEDDERRIDFVPPSWEELLWRKSREEASKEISVLVPLSNGRDRKSVCLDYLPMIRNICRLEKNRLTANSKRKNRFYHYLSNLGVEFTEENLDINCDVFKC